MRSLKEPDELFGNMLLNTYSNGDCPYGWGRERCCSGSR